LDGERTLIRFDPELRSFKQSLVAIVFAGMYIEARLWIEGCRRLGRDLYERVDREKLEERLKRIGISDPDLMEACAEFRQARRELVHEKAMPPAGDDEKIRIAQKEAANALALMHRIDAELKQLPTSPAPPH
jgi:hypothetical protein